MHIAHSLTRPLSLLPSWPLQDMQDYLQATIMRQSSPEEAFRRFDELATRHVEVGIGYQHTTICAPVDPTMKRAW